MTKKALYPIEESPLYKLKSRRKLIDLLGINSYSELKALVFDSDSYYKEFSKAKKDGNPRHIKAPVGKIKRVGKKLSDLIRRIETPAYHMSKRGSCCKKNAELHKNNDYLFTTDIGDFFPNCKRLRIAHSFKEHFKMSGDIAFVLSKLLTFQGRVPQGSHASDIVCFWSNYSMFEEVNKFCIERGLCFSLYADDIAISSEDHINPEYRYGVVKILRKNGFEIKEEKTKYFKKGKVKHINGIAIKDGRIAIENSKMKKLFTGLDKFKRGEVDFESIMGQYNYCRHIDPKFAPTLEKKIRLRSDNHKRNFQCPH